MVIEIMMKEKEFPVNPTQNVMFASCADATSKHLRFKVISVIHVCEGAVHKYLPELMVENKSFLAKILSRHPGQNMSCQLR